MINLNSYPSTLQTLYGFALSLIVGGFISGCSYFQETNFEPAYGQLNSIESLDMFLETGPILDRINGYPTISQKLDTLLFLTERLKNYNQSAALTYAKMANQLAKKNRLDLSMGISSYYIALLKGRQQSFGEGIEDAIVDAQISYDLFQKLKNEEWLIKINNLRGILFYAKPDFDSAKVYQLKALEIASNSSLPENKLLYLKGEIFHDLGNIFSKNRNTRDSALAYYNKSLALYQKTNNLSALSRLRIAMGDIFIAQGKYELADSMLRKSVAYAVDAKDNGPLVEAYESFGKLRYYQYKKTKDTLFFKEAESFFLKSLRRPNETPYYPYQMLGQLYQLSAVYNKNFVDLDSAILFYKKAMDNAHEEGALGVMRSMVRNITGLCGSRKENKDCKDLLGDKTMDFLNNHYAGIVDTITNNLKETNLRIRGYEKEVQEERSKHRIRNLWIISGVGLVFAVLVFLILLQRQQQKRLEARMDALRAQINPHFISNSLNAIESLINLDKKEAAAKYIIQFSRLSRRILNGSRESTTTLAEEIQTLEYFLSLEQLRFRDKLQYSFEVSPGLNPQMIEIPPMILQPYLENAIWHGIKPKKGPGTLKIKIERTGKYLICIVEDDGVGREKAQEIKAASVLQQKSVGMKITQERLQALGNVTGSQVEIVDLKDTQGLALGTRVIVRLPFKLKKAKSIKT